MIQVVNKAHEYFLIKTVVRV